MVLFGFMNQCCTSDHPHLLSGHEQQEERENALHALLLQGASQVVGDEIVEIEQIFIGALKAGKESLEVGLYSSPENRGFGRHAPEKS